MTMEITMLYYTTNSDFNIKSNGYFESLNNFESPTKSLNIMSQRTLALTQESKK